MANVKKKQTRQERLKKRQAEKLLYQRIKNDPARNAELKEKERQQYKKKKGMGQIKSVKNMTEREKRAIRKIWREKTKKHRDRVKPHQHHLCLIMKINLHLHQTTSP